MIKLKRCPDRRSLDAFVSNTLTEFFKNYDYPKDALVLVKPNFNSDMIALTGNTTDLRIIVSLVGALRSRGYNNIVLGDGTSSGFLNSGIDVLARLGVKRLCERLGIGCEDFNEAEAKKVPFLGSTIKIAAVCLEADILINLPKLKTHAEAGMSACLKNLIGCVVGRDKQKVHISLPEGILRLSEILRPQLNIVDALISMEGTGPSRGLPKLTGLLISGDDSFAVDLALARLCGIDYKDVPYLSLALKEGLARDRDIALNEAGGFNFRRPAPGILFRLINSQRWRKFFAAARYAPFFKEAISSSVLSAPLYALGARQDFFIKEDDAIEEIALDSSLCNKCNTCVEYCPLSIDIPGQEKVFPGCIKCFCCYFVCPSRAIILKGRVGYLAYQLNHYRRLIIQELTKTCACV